MFEQMIEQGKAEKQDSARIKKKLLILAQAVGIGLASFVGQEGMIAYQNYRATEQHSERIERAISPEEQERTQIENLLQGKYKRLLDRYNEKDIENDLVFAIEQGKRFQEEKGQKQQGMEVQAIETRDGSLQWSQVQDTLANLPESWTVGKVESVRFLDGMERIDKGYTVNGVLADTGSDMTTGESKIRFFDSAKNEPIEYIIQAIDHEVSHANDWRRRPDLSLEERLQLFEEVSDRSFAGDRYDSSYVESIKEKDRARENYDKAVEYWAEVCETYFTNPQNLNVKDFNLVDHYIRKTDPGFKSSDTVAFNHALVEAVKSRAAEGQSYAVHADQEQQNQEQPTPEQ